NNPSHKIAKTIANRTCLCHDGNKQLVRQWLLAYPIKQTLSKQKEPRVGAHELAAKTNYL
ncbi:MAG: hypothetical protein AAB834_02405, partial [Patescibacteria group bacterium]